MNGGRGGDVVEWFNNGSMVVRMVQGPDRVGVIGLQ